MNHPSSPSSPDSSSSRVPPTRRHRPRLSAAVLVAALVTSLVPLGCNKPPYIWASEVPSERARPPERTIPIRSGDVVSVTVVGQAQMSMQHTVGADGTIPQPELGSVLIAGKSAPEAEEELAKRLRRLLKNPEVSVVVVTRQIEIGILGEVNGPGRYALSSGDTIATALVMAGGISDFGNENAIYLVRDSEPVRVRFRMKDLTRGGDSAQRFVLRDGDLLVVE